jgi:hypothetical protein
MSKQNDQPDKLTVAFLISLLSAASFVLASLVFACMLCVQVSRLPGGGQPMCSSSSFFMVSMGLAGLSISAAVLIYGISMYKERKEKCSNSGSTQKRPD